MAHDIERAGKESPRKPWLLDFRSSNGVILATVCVAIFTVRTLNCWMYYSCVWLTCVLYRMLSFTVWYAKSHHASSMGAPGSLEVPITLKKILLGVAHAHQDRSGGCSRLNIKTDTTHRSFLFYLLVFEKDRVYRRIRVSILRVSCHGH